MFNDIIPSTLTRARELLHVRVRVMSKRVATVCDIVWTFNLLDLHTVHWSTGYIKMYT